MPKRVLIIDDDKSIRDYVTDILTAEGYYVIEKSNADEGLKELFKKSNNSFDIIICDIMMPGKNGFEFLKKIKNKKMGMPIFIYITANKEREFLRTAMESGADDYITKPFTPGELLKSVQVQEAKKSFLEKTISEAKKNKKTEPTSKVIETRINRFKEKDKIFISNKEKAGFVNISDILVIQSLKDYTRLYTFSKKTFYIRKPLKRWQLSLPENIFLLANRSMLINIKYVNSIKKMPNHTHEVILKNFPHKVYISRRISTKLRTNIKSI